MHKLFFKFFFIVLLFILLFSNHSTIHALQSIEGLELILHLEVPIVTIASGKEEKLTKAPANVHHISKEQIHERGYKTVEEILMDLPGTHLNYQVGSYGHIPSIRGQWGSQRLKIMINGMSINPRSTLPIALNSLYPVTHIERVEYIVGPYASLYGRDSFSGVINIISKKGKDINGIYTKLAYGSWNQYQADFIYGKKIGDFDILFSLYNNKTNDGWDIPDDYPESHGLEYRRNSGVRVWDTGNVNEDFFLTWDNLDMYLRVLHDSGISIDVLYNRPKFPKIGTTSDPRKYFQNDDTQTKEDNLVFRTLYEYKNNKISSVTSFEYQYFRMDQLNGYLPYTDDSTQERYWSTYRYWSQANRGFLFKERFIIKLNNYNELLLGLTYEDLENFLEIGSTQARKTSKPNLSDWDEEDKIESTYLNFTIQDKIDLNENFKLVLGVMFESSDSYEDVILPRVSLMWEPNDKLVLKFLYGGGHISPSPTVYADQGIILGNSNLNPESLTSYELNLRYEINERTYITASLYYNEISNVIGQVLLPQKIGNVSKEWKNKGSSEATGIDLNLYRQFTENIKMFFQTSYVDGKIYSDTSPTIEGLPLSPDLIFRCGINILLFDHKLNIFLRDQYTGKNRTISGPTEVLDGFNSFDIFINTTDSLNENWFVSFQIKNLFSEKGRNPIKYASSDPVHAVYPLINWIIQVGKKF